MLDSALKFSSILTNRKYFNRFFFHVKVNFDQHNFAIRRNLADDKSDWLHHSKTIKEVLDGLRNKKTNVLIATSVVEEGVDVEACAFVISFDNIKSTKAYVQMKGRGEEIVPYFCDEQ